MEDSKTDSSVEVIKEKAIPGRQKGFVYYIDRDGSIYQTNRLKEKTKLAKVDIKKEKGWFYYLDSDCNLVRRRMVSYVKRKPKN